MFSFRHKPEGTGGHDKEEKRLSRDAEDYIKKLADSLIKKSRHEEAPPGKDRPFWSEIEEEAPKPPSNRRTEPKRPARQPSRQSEKSPEKKAKHAPKPAPEQSAAPTRDELRQEAQERGESPEEMYYDEKGMMREGTIISFEDGGMGVFQKTLPQKGYDVVYMLEEDGTAKPQGMPLYNYDILPVGLMSRKHLSLIAQASAWERDLIVFNLTRYEDREKIPPYTGEMEAPTEQAARPDPREMKAQGDDDQLVRGRRISIPFGEGKTWEAVYWGKDELGDVVAHKTHGTWSLMHLELGRFRNSMKLGEVLDYKELHEMEKDFIPE